MTLSVVLSGLYLSTSVMPAHAQQQLVQQRAQQLAQPLAQQLALSETLVGGQKTDDSINPAQVPLPGPLRQVPTETFRPDSSPNTPADAVNENGDAAGEKDVTRPHISAEGAIPEVSYDYSKLPQAVQDTRKKILDIAKTGKIDALKPLLGDGGETSPLLSLGEYDGTPLEYLKSLSGDDKGQEILAILADLLESGYVHLDAGTPSDLYVWPYFFAYPLDKLDDRQMVELYQIITAGDFEEMKGVGAYIFYRIGISPDGSWKFFVAGD